MPKLRVDQPKVRGSSERQLQIKQAQLNFPNFRVETQYVRDNTIRNRAKVRASSTADQFPVRNNVFEQIFEEISKISVAKSLGLVFGIFCVPFLGSFWQLVHSIVTVGVGRLVLFQFLACLLYSSFHLHLVVLQSGFQKNCPKLVHKTLTKSI